MEARWGGKVEVTKKTNNADQVRGFTRGAFHSAQHFRNFRLKSNGTDHFGSVRQEYLTRDKIVVPSTALLYPAYKNNNQTRSGLGQVCTIPLDT